MANETILLVDDEEEIISFIQDALEFEGYQVLTAGSGQEALIQSKQRPSLIILDVMMPDMNGIAVCERLETQCPIVFLSACQSEVDRIRGLVPAGTIICSSPLALLN